MRFFWAATSRTPSTPSSSDELKGIMIDTPDLGKLSAYDLVHKRYEQMKQGRDVFEPFTGPIKTTRGP
jgi:basic membrane protein A